jgi:hypothetical protein
VVFYSLSDKHPFPCGPDVHQSSETWKPSTPAVRPVKRTAFTDSPFELRPPDLDKLGLAAALTAKAELVSQRAGFQALTHRRKGSRNERNSDPLPYPIQGLLQMIIQDDSKGSKGVQARALESPQSSRISGNLEPLHFANGTIDLFATFPSWNPTYIHHTDPAGGG